MTAAYWLIVVFGVSSPAALSIPMPSLAACDAALAAVPPKDSAWSDNIGPVRFAFCIPGAAP